MPTSIIDSQSLGLGTGVPQNPNAQRTRSTWQVGQTAEFKFQLVSRAGTPVEMLDNSLYPAFAFVDPTGMQVQTGVAQPVDSAGNYLVTWTIPLQSVISNDQQSWQLQISGVTKKRHQVQCSFDFNIVDKQTTATGRRDVIQTALAGKPYRAVWRGDFDPDELALECYATDRPDDVGKAPLVAAVDKALCTKVLDGDSIGYYYDIPANAFVNGTTTMFDNKFSVLWSVRETPLSEQDVEWQQLRVVKRRGFDMMSGLRWMVDRFQHRFGTAQHMSDGDLVEALTRGLGTFNQWFPYSQYTAEQIPDCFHTFWISFASVYMLQSQRLLVNSMSFSFSGQSTTLDFDQTGGIDSAISGMTEWLNTHCTAAKTMFYRQRSATGVVGVRPARLANGLNNRVIKVDSTGPDGGMASPGLLGMAQLIGLTP
jgi:hypothetical protein